MNRREFIGKATTDVATAITVPRIISCSWNKKGSPNTITVMPSVRAWYLYIMN